MTNRIIRHKVTNTHYRVLDQVRDDSGAAFDAWWVQHSDGTTRKLSGQVIAQNYEPVSEGSMPSVSRDLIYVQAARAALEFVEHQARDADWGTHDLVRVVVDAVWDSIKESE